MPRLSTGLWLRALEMAAVLQDEYGAASAIQVLVAQMLSVVGAQMLLMLYTWRAAARYDAFKSGLQQLRSCAIMPLKLCDGDKEAVVRGLAVSCLLLGTRSEPTHSREGF
jgi:hypothetical protein